MSYITKSKMAAYIDHTNLHADATASEIATLCNEAIEYGFASVCIHPARIEIASKILAESDVEVCTVCGFPLGATFPSIKAQEAAESIRLGADEIDMVINIGAVKDKEWSLIKDEVNAVSEVTKEKTLKVIIETCYLTDEEISKVCKIVENAGADYIKTSTGFGTAGASIKSVKKMKAASCGAKIKAAGGIKTLSSALAMIAAGADRLGTSAGISIINEISQL